ncbi:MAG: bifunctional adenosylcobinamide kinase/adenosylcobinamide-phosphate guanylyltransferase [Cyanobacteria bacterium]|nr:bifunctional adenosylcobinamide kinase/adenosylcobinamide-phosphate guanylyltransferase [Cyanobacteriota bacterium]
MSFSNLTVITGGARSGKSALAEKIALQTSCEKVLYVATMPRVEGDDELDYRIERHRRRRPSNWGTLEAESCLPARLSQLPGVFDVCILDCLSLYISNILFVTTCSDNDREGAIQSVNVSGQLSRTEIEVLESRVEDAIDELLSMIEKQKPRQFIVVTNEVGWSVVPENGMARIYRDLLGFANQKMARSAGDVFLCCSGLQLALKTSNTLDAGTSP